MPDNPGKPRFYIAQDDPLKLIAVRLSNWHILQIKKLGEGNLSVGMRRAIENAVYAAGKPVERKLKNYE